jgi:hypothetical protein
VQKILHIAKRKRETNVHHHGQADDLRACLEVTKGGTFCHPEGLGGRPARLKKVSSDSAHFSVERKTTPFSNVFCVLGFFCLKIACAVFPRLP